MDICCTGPPSVLDDAVVAAGSRIHYIPKSANCYRTAGRIAAILSNRKYDVIHSHFGHTAGGEAVAGARAHVPTVVSIHTSVPVSLYHWRTHPVLGHLRSAWLEWHRRLMDDRVTIYVGHSEANLRPFAPQWPPLDKRRYRVILNGVQFPISMPTRESARRSLQLAPDSLVLLHVGSFKEEKNHRGLFRILRLALDQGRDATLLVVGDGVRRELVKRAARECKVEHCIRFEGQQEDVWPYYAAADVFIFPSVVEGFGNVLIESQAAGLPIVASDIPPHRESVAPCQHRFLFPPEECDLAVRHVFTQLDASRRGTNGWVADSRRWARQFFSIERFASDLLKLYRDVR
jgi:glycosyltransferase EpsF